MLDTTWGRWAVALIAAAAIVALLVWARNEPGVGGRDPDPPPASSLVGEYDTSASGRLGRHVEPPVGPAASIAGRGGDSTHAAGVPAAPGGVHRVH